MRPAGRGPLDSLYFEYPDFEARPAPEAAGTSVVHPVAIVGAGPIGMVAALTLARYGIRSVLLDRKATFNDGSRATCIARSSFQIFEQIGAVGPFLDKSLGWRSGRSYYRGREFYRFDMPHSEHDKFLPMYNLQQQYTEQFLWNAVAASPLIDARWQSEVAGLETRSDGTKLRIASPTGSYDLHADFVLAADGARSRIRELMGLRLAGNNHEGRYVIADVKMAHDFPTERRAFFGSTANPGGTVLIHRQPDDIWRIDYQLGAHEDEATAMEEPSIRARVSAILAEVGHTGGYDLEWWSVYSANTLCLDDYRHGRVIFIGDSAHIVPIFGVRGLNNGIADAFNAGWKLAYVLNGDAAPSLLDSYTPERRGATLDVFVNATKSTRFMTPPSRGWTLARDAALSLALRHPFVSPLANPRQMQPHTYADSPITATDDDCADFTAGPVGGALAANVTFGPHSFLFDLAGKGFTGLLFTDRTVDQPVVDMMDRLSALDPAFRLLMIAAVGRHVEGVTIDDPRGDAGRLFGARPGTFYLLRPDLHVAGRWLTLDADRIVRTLATILGRMA
jgi:3-(3-hydroxy-phenyl)propionate hydroxylase